MSSERTPHPSPGPASHLPAPYSGQVLAIHYSCERVEDCPNRTPQVSTIVVEEVEADEFHTFAVYLIAERLGIRPEEIPRQLTALEKRLLEEFYAFAASRPEHYWLHWNMNEIWFGFSALEQRASVLGVQPFSIAMARRINLAAVLVQTYGDRYIPHPRMLNVIRKNGISDRGLLSREEAKAAWEQGNYSALATSVRRKVDCIARIYYLYHKGFLKIDRPVIPRWDAERRELHFGGTLVKRYTKAATDQERLLATFEEEGWPTRIDDPLDPGKLRDVLKNLSVALGPGSLLRFGGDGTGKGVTWSQATSDVEVSKSPSTS